jgi:hypothetical protein
LEAGLGKSVSTGERARATVPIFRLQSDDESDDADADDAPETCGTLDADEPEAEGAGAGDTERATANDFSDGDGNIAKQQLSNE